MLHSIDHNSAIGIFDSGVGGISVANQIRQLLPNEKLIYIADSANAPYGSKSTDFLHVRAHQLTQYLLKHGCKLIVVACNTATVNTIKQLRSEYQIPFVGVEPGIKPAVALSKNGNIGIWATESTLKSDTYQQLVESYGQQKNIYSTACHGLAELVETGNLDHPSLRQQINHYLAPVIKSEIDTLVLGCTHYPFLIPLLSQMIPQEMTLIDTSEAIALQVKRLLVEQQLLATHEKPTHCVYTSLLPHQQVDTITGLWGTSVAVQPLTN